MSSYVIGDIHGCYNDFQNMLSLIGFTSDDLLIMVGDYIDRGSQNYEMLEWIMSRRDNIILIKGNHEEEFVSNINLMININKKCGLNTNYNSTDETKSLYDSCFYYIKKTNPLMILYFDTYDTIRKLIYESGVCFQRMIEYKNRLHSLPYYYKKENLIVVHAGYINDYEKIKNKYSSIEDFYLYARDDGFIVGGIKNGIIVSGHTPTIEKGEFCYNDGDIYHYYNNKNNCHYYDIDGGIVFRDNNPSAQLCCLRLDDMEEFYI